MDPIVFGAMIEAFIGIGVEKALSAAITATRSSNSRILVSTDVTSGTASVKEHLEFVRRWSSEIRFQELGKSKKLTSSFVELECYVGQVVPEGIVLNEAPRLASSLLNNEGHFVILGRPGAGKTTTVQRLALTALDRYLSDKAAMPIVLRIRDLSVTQSALDRLALLAGIQVSQVRPNPGEDPVKPEKLRETLRRAVTTYLDNINALLFLDGLDECPPSVRQQVEKEITSLMEHASASQVVLTCRSADYVFSFPAQAYTLLPLKPEDVRKFAVKWLGSAQARTFADQLNRSPYRGAEVVPITLAHLCAIFERRGEIPEQPRYVYQKIVRLLLEEWDEQHGVRRESRYAGFEVDRKLEFLRRIAFELTIADNRGTFTHANLERAYLRCHLLFRLPPAECSRVAREIESHNGLILHSSHDRYEFAHKSIQEFLTAEYLSRLPHVPHANFLALGEELAIATALSGRSELYLQSVAEILFDLSPGVARERFARVFLGRMALERPDFVPTETLGWTILAVLDTTCPNQIVFAATSVATDVSSRLLQLLLADQVVADALTSAVNTATRYTETQQISRIVPPADQVLPPRISGYVNKRKNPGLLLDNEAINTMLNVNANPRA